VSPRVQAVLRIAAFVLSIVCLPTYGAAEWQFAPFLGYTFGGATTIVDLEDAAGDRRWHIGGAARVVGEGPLGVEGLFVYTPGFFQRREAVPIEEARVTGSRTYALMGNAVLTTPHRGTQYGLRPYVSGGVGLLHASAYDLLDVVLFDLNLVGMNAGGGAVGFISDRVGLRFDLRYFRKIHGPDEEELEFPVTFFEPIRLRYWTGSVGIVFRY
jgi:hypothetical protein